MPSNLQAQIQATIQKFAAKIDAAMTGWRQADNATSFREMELDVAKHMRELGDLIVGHILTDRVEDPVFQAETSAAARTAGKFISVGRRAVTVTLLGGSELRLTVRYMKRDLRGRVGRRRSKRGRGGTGVFPMLAALGIWFGVTPALAGEICRQVADSDSVRAARAALARHGRDLGHKETLRVVNGFSNRSVEHRSRWLEVARKRPLVSGPLAGKRVVVCTDGGRLRERVPASAGRPRSRTGHRRYDAPWREPKVMGIYVVDDSGKGLTDVAPVYDATLQNADAVFAMIAGYLRALGAHEAKQLIVVGDGAHWIWKRVPALIAQIGIASSRVVEVIDWYHAVQTIHEVAAKRARWSQSERESWIAEAISLLRKNRVDEVVTMIDELSRGRRAKDVSKHRAYFADNAFRMQYASFKAKKIPRGSGAIESAVRRIVNMRMKGNGTFWLEANAEGMLMLRSYLKAGRFDALVDWSLSTAASWWRCDETSQLLACGAAS